MMDVYLLAAVRMRELELRREAELARWRREPRDVGRSVSRSRIVLAQWLIVAAVRLWPEGAPKVMGGAR
jgi:hypothetical protein